MALPGLLLLPQPKILIILLLLQQPSHPPVLLPLALPRFLTRDSAPLLALVPALVPAPLLALAPALLLLQIPQPIIPRLTPLQLDRLRSAGLLLVRLDRLIAQSTPPHLLPLQCNHLLTLNQLIRSVRPPIWPPLLLPIRSEEPPLFRFNCFASHYLRGLPLPPNLRC